MSAPAGSLPSAALPGHATEAETERGPARSWARRLGVLGLLFLLSGASLAHLPLAGRALWPAEASYWLPELQKLDAENQASGTAQEPHSAGFHRPAAPQDLSATDTFAYLLPNLLHWKEAVARRDLESLYWRSDLLAGTPFLATAGTAALYPGNLLVFAVPVVWLPFAIAWLHLFIALWGGYALAARRLSSDFARLVTALGFGLGGWIAIRLDLWTIVQAAAWAPWILVAADAAACCTRRGKRIALALGLGVAIALSALGGFPQVTILALLAAGVLVAVRAGEALLTGPHRATKLAGTLARPALGVLLGLAFAAPQLIPTAAFAAQSDRSGSDLQAWRQLTPSGAEWWELALPGLFGLEPELEAASRPSRGSLPTGTNESNHPLAQAVGLGAIGTGSIERGLFLGWIGLIFAGFSLSLANLRRRQAATLSALLLVALAGAVLLDTPLLPLIHGVDALAFGNPRRFLFLLALALPLLAGLGAQAFRDRLRSDRAPVGLFLAPATLALALVLLMRLAPESLAESFGLPDPLPAAFATLGTRAALVAVLGLALATGGTILARRTRRPVLRSLGLGLVLVGLFLELADWHQRTNPGQSPQNPLPPRAAAAELAQHTGPGRIVRIAARSGALDPLPPNLGAHYGLRDLQGYEALLDRRLEALLQSSLGNIVFAHHLVGALPNSERLDHPTLDLLGVDRVLTRAADPAPPGSSTRVGPLRLTAREGALALVTAPQRALICKDEDAVLAALAKRSNRPAETTHLTAEEATPLFGAALWPLPRRGAQLTLPGPEAAPRVERTGTATWTITPSPQDPQGRWALRFAWVGLPGFELVPRETPGSSEDEPAACALVPADHALMLAVGRGPAELRYRPVGFLLGWILAASAGIGGMVLLVADLRRRRRFSSKSVRAVPAGEEAILSLSAPSSDPR